MKPKIGRNSRLSNKIMIAALNLPRQRKPLTKGPGTLAKQKLMPVLLERYFSTWIESRTLKEEICSKFSAIFDPKTKEWGWVKESTLYQRIL